MIIREVTKEPRLLGCFDWFNDYTDTRQYLVTCNEDDLVRMLDAGHAAWLKKDQETFRKRKGMPVKSDPITYLFRKVHLHDNGVQETEHLTAVSADSEADARAIAKLDDTWTRAAAGTVAVTTITRMVDTPMRDAVEKLIKAKGRFHTQRAYEELEKIQVTR